MESKKQFLETSVDSERQKLNDLKFQYNEMDEEIQLELTDKKKMVELLDTQLETKKLVLEITNEDLKQKSDFLELVDVVKQMIQSYLPLQPDIEEFANTVERGASITGGNSIRSILSTLGQLLLSFKDMVQEGFCWFPRLMRWNTSKGEVAPVFRDDPGGYNYKLEAFRNVETKVIYRAENLKDEICSDNRVGTLEQIKESVEVIQQQVRSLEVRTDRDIKR